MCEHFAALYRWVNAVGIEISVHYRQHFKPGLMMNERSAAAQLFYRRAHLVRFIRIAEEIGNAGKNIGAENRLSCLFDYIEKVTNVIIELVLRILVNISAELNADVVVIVASGDELRHLRLDFSVARKAEI